MRLRVWSAMIAAFVLLTQLAACSGAVKMDTIELKLDQQNFAIKPWKSDGSHMTSVQGKVLADGKPVAHAAVRLTETRILETDENGAFNILLDQSKIAKIQLSVQSAANATVSGKKLTADTTKKLLAASTEINVFYPIEISKVNASTTNPDQVEIRGRAILQGGDSFPTLLIDKYAVYGVVKDAAGNPVKNAVVNINRSGVEGFAQAEPSNSKGEYIFYYVPEDDEEIYLKVHVGDKKYTLPDQKVYFFPNDTSVETNITLPKEGTIITDEPPYLVSRTAPGALYKGVVIGVTTNGADYTATIPEQDGTFVLTLPKKVWEQSPHFFETLKTSFLKDPVEPGDALPSSFIGKPDLSEPDRIEAKKLY